MWKALDSRDDIPNWLARALKMILLTGARPGEILNLRWEQLKDGWFELSGDETKNDHPTRIYLSSLAKLIMGSPGEGPLFVKDDGKLPEVYDLSAWLRRRDRLGLAHWSAHDLRRTCTTGLAELGTLPHVVDRILNHVLKGVTERHYNKYLYAAEIAAALDAWGRKISTALAEKDVEQPGLAKVIRLFK
jgi:integrase